MDIICVILFAWAILGMMFIAVLGDAPDNVNIWQIIFIGIVGGPFVWLIVILAIVILGPLFLLVYVLDKLGMIGKEKKDDKGK